MYAARSVLSSGEHRTHLSDEWTLMNHRFSAPMISNLGSRFWIVSNLCNRLCKSRFTGSGDKRQVAGQWLVYRFACSLWKGELNGHSAGGWPFESLGYSLGGMENSNNFSKFARSCTVQSGVVNKKDSSISWFVTQLIFFITTNGEAAFKENFVIFYDRASVQIWLCDKCIQGVAIVLKKLRLRIENIKLCLLSLTIKV